MLQKQLSFIVRKILTIFILNTHEFKILLYYNIMLYVIIFHDELFFVTRIDYGISGVYISETVKALVKRQNCDYKSDINYIF